ncbi:MAG: (d)CMP kinase [Firmicutes bacterium]|nr:(d)CMP kinase [Bacillota bacterium]MBR2575973.1 (d)CMP kinase [Bacillota bacterium]
MSNKLIIAIDGPAGAGKSTVARIIAEIFGCEYIDTGAMYRAITYKCVQRLVDIDDDDELNELLDETTIAFKDKKIYLDGRPVEEEIRTPKISSMVSKVAEKKQVREMLVEAQRKIGEEVSVVMDGRDIGTTVFPDAQFKFFITASVDERADRRYKELIQKGYDASKIEIYTEIKKRDEYDTNRTLNPLRRASDAIVIDTTKRTINDVVDEICERIRRS